jgi:hypothetical protein
MSKILVVDSEAGINAANSQIWLEKIKEAIIDPKKQVCDDFETVILSTAGLTVEGAAELHICGKRKGCFDSKKGATTAWAKPCKAYQIEKWFIPKPDDKYLINVSGYSILDKQPIEWAEPDDL